MFKLIEFTHVIYFTYTKLCVATFATRTFWLLESLLSAVLTVLVSLCWFQICHCVFMFVNWYAYGPVLITDHRCHVGNTTASYSGGCMLTSRAKNWLSWLFLGFTQFFSVRSRDGLPKYVVDPLHSTSIPFIIGRYNINCYIHSVVQRLHAETVNLCYVDMSKCIWLNERLSINVLLSGELWVLCQARTLTDDYTGIKLFWGTGSVYVDSTMLRYRSGHL